MSRPGRSKPHSLIYDFSYTNHHLHRWDYLAMIGKNLATSRLRLVFPRQFYLDTSTSSKILFSSLKILFNSLWFVYYAKFLNGAHQIMHALTRATNSLWYFMNLIMRRDQIKTNSQLAKVPKFTNVTHKIFIIKLWCSCLWMSARNVCNSIWTKVCWVNW